MASILWLRLVSWFATLGRQGGERVHSKWPTAGVRQEMLIVLIGGLIALAPFALMGLFLDFF